MCRTRCRSTWKTESLGWLIDPQNQRVQVYRPGQPVEILEEPATVPGDPVLPGFVLNLSVIW